MRLVKLLISITLLILLGYGWLTTGKDTLLTGSKYNNYMKAGDKSYKVRLYQDAAEKYGSAWEEKNTLESMQKQIDAATAYYETFAEEDYSERHALISLLDHARASYPDKEEFLLQEIELYLSENSFDDAKKLCEKVIEKTENEKIKEYWEQIITSVSEEYKRYTDYKSFSNGFFGVYSATGWSVIDDSLNEIHNKNYLQLGMPGKEGYYLGQQEGQDILFYDLKGIARGITSNNYTELGIAQEGLAPAKRESGEWFYVDTDGEECLGPYLNCGVFENGLAAVEDKNHQWDIINKQGIPQNDRPFVDIKLDTTGHYLNQGVIVAAIESGSYQLWDDKYNVVGDDVFEDADAACSEGFIAVCKDGKWGYIDAEGNVRIESEYDGAKSFSNGLAAVEKNGEWSLINQNGDIILEDTYAFIDYVSSKGHVMVSEDGNIYHFITFDYLQDFVNYEERK